MSKTFGVTLVLLTFLQATASLMGQEVLPETVRLKFVGANPAAQPMSLTDLPEPRLRFLRGGLEPALERTPEVARAHYHDIYPGIDLICYDDGYSLEYVFILSPGADPSLIRMTYDGPMSYSINQTGCIIMPIRNGEMIQGPPVAFLKTEGTRIGMDGLYNIGSGGIISVDVPQFRSTQAAKFNGSIFNLVPAGGQPGGPSYSYYLSKHEITQDQYLRFLNDAEANPKSAQGSFMFFDRQGNAWINPEMRTGRDEMFTLANSRLAYDPEKPLGSRYDHVRAGDKSAPFALYPVSGVSWYGAVKYCNWLTLESQRTPAECAYREGTNALDWAPVTATNWSNGFFGNAERELWLGAKGFRLPMVNCNVPVQTTNDFNEFYKASVWGGFTNGTYGFGRSRFDGTDASCRETIGLRKPTPLPVGFFDGERLLGKIQTHANENLYGVLDLTGNIGEWVNDFAVRGDPGARMLCGGAWDESLKPSSVDHAAPPHSAETANGFRPMTTYMPSEVLIIHILYTFFMEPNAVTGRVEEVVMPIEEVPPEAAAAAVTPEVAPSGTRITGLLYSTPPTPPTPPEIPPPGPGPIPNPETSP